MYVCVCMRACVCVCMMCVCVCVCVCVCIHVPYIAIYIYFAIFLHHNDLFLHRVSMIRCSAIGGYLWAYGAMFVFLQTSVQCCCSSYSLRESQ